MRYKIVYPMVLTIFLMSVLTCSADVLIDELNKSAKSWQMAITENTYQDTGRFEKLFRLETQITKNTDKIIKDLLKQPNGFQNLRRTVQKNLAAYPYNPQGKYYSKNGFGAYFTMNGNAIAFLLSFSKPLSSSKDNEDRDNFTFCPGISVIWHTPVSNSLLFLDTEEFFGGGFLPVPPGISIDVFQKKEQPYFFAWGGPQGTGHYSWFSLSTIKADKLFQLKNHEFSGDIISYDFESKFLATREWDEKNEIKQEWIHGAKPVYDIEYTVGTDIQITNRKCLNPWYLVTRDYLAVVRMNDTKKAEGFLVKKEILIETRNFKYTEVKTPVESVQDDGWESDYAETDTKIVTLHYADEKHNINSREDFYLKQFSGEWKIIDIRNKISEK